MKLNSEQDAIKQALEAGYKTSYHDLQAIGDGYKPERILQDPAFWQALGKARGWESPYGVCPNCEELSEMEAWKYHALRYFETKLSGGDTNQFWLTLP